MTLTGTQSDSLERFRATHAREANVKSVIRARPP